MAPDAVELRIDDRAMAVAVGTLLVEAARRAGIDVPVFCYHEKLAPVGACRMCLVEVEGMPRMQTACTTPVAAGMVVRTRSARTRDAQNAVLELLLANHPLDCPICDKGGECPLQDNAFRYGGTHSRMAEEKRHLAKAVPLTRHIALDRERCIMCLRCTRFHQEVAGDEALLVRGRGGGSEIDVGGAGAESPFMGNTVELCPVGALTSRAYRFRARPWDLRRTPSVCVGCAVGCNVMVHARDADLLRLVARPNAAVDDGWLCDHGRYATLPARPTQEPGGRPALPLVRRGDRFEPVAAEAALQHAARLLRQGPTVLAASGNASNEALARLAGRVRASLPGARLTCGPGCRTPWPVRGRIADLAAVRRVLLVGLDPWQELPVLGLWLRKAVRNGARLVVVDEHNGMARDSALWLRAPRAALHQPLAELRAGLIAGALPELAGDGPGAVLAGVDALDDPAALALTMEMAAMCATLPGSVCGAPPLSANGRGACDLIGGDGAVGVAAVPATVLAVGGEPAQVQGGRVVLATAAPFADRPELEVVLPTRHLYEQGGTITNLDGTVQALVPAGAGNALLADYELLDRLAAVLERER